MNQKILALVLLCVAGGLLLTAGLLTWGGFNRWRAHGALVEAQDKALAGNAGGARTIARTAADLFPYEAAAVLAAADLSSQSTGEVLVRIAPHASGNDKSALAAGASIALGKAPEGLEPNVSDAALIQAILARAPGPVKLNKDTPPHLAVLTNWAAMRLSVALTQQRPTDLYEAASALLTLVPRHPQAVELRLFIAALAPDSTTPQIIAAAAGINDIERRNRLGQHLVAMLPERTALRILLPGGGDAAASEAETIRKMVATAKLQPTTINEGLVIRCLQAGKTDSADELIAAMSGPRQTEFSSFGDLLNGGSFATSPAHITRPVSINSSLAFHLSNSVGGIPTKKILVIIGDTEVPPDQVRRQGTLVTIPLRVTGEQDVTIRYDGNIIFASKIPL